MEFLFNTTEALCKLRKAFNDLRREGVSAHMRCACCKTCGAPMPVVPKPFVYVTREDELAFQSAGILPIHYIDTDGSDTGCMALGQQVRIILEIQGLTVEWEENPWTPIIVMA